jgi:type IV secretion system protein VirD4
LNGSKWKKKLILCLPYISVGLIFTNFGEAWRLAEGVNASEKLQDIFQSGTLQLAFQNLLPSLYPTDLIVGIVCGAALRLAVYLKGKNAKKYRQGEEYGSARWGTHADIEPFEDPEFENNLILSQSERITMSSRPPVPKYARNKNMLVVGGSGSGKTRFVLKPNLLQCCSKKYPVSFVITDPKGSIVNESAHALVVNGYEIRIFNTINFHKSMHYNPFAYIHDEKDILKLVTALMANTKGEGNGGDPFWEKSEKLLYTALIGYIHYEAPVEEQNFATLLEMLNSMEVREDDETFKNPVDLLFDELEQKEPEHFAVRQFRKYKLAAGVITSKSSFNTRDNKVRVEAVLRGFYILEKGGRCYAERQHHCSVRTSVPRRRTAGRIKQYQQSEKDAYGLCKGTRPAESSAFHRRWDLRHPLRPSGLYGHDG